MFDLALHAYLRALMQPHADRVGPFLISLDHHDPGLFRNYAVPDDQATPTPDEVEQLIAFFIHRGRTPRLEYLPALSPAVEPALIAQRFTRERRLPVMTCQGQATSRRPPDEIDIALAFSDQQLRQVAEAQNEAYGQAETTDHDVARLRRTIANGGLVGLALDRTTGLGVGGGLCSPPHQGLSELAAIGVRSPYRRRGIATALTVLLTRACPDYGITTPFLTPAGEQEQQIYQAAGYRPVTDMLHISR